MTDLFERVLHHLEGGESAIRNWETAEGIRPDVLKTFGPERWIERVHERGVLSAFDCISLIFFALDEIGIASLEQRRNIVDGWAAELRNAAFNDEIHARDPITLLALAKLPDGWDWTLSMIDADKFVATRGMDWKCSEIATHLFNEYATAINRNYFPSWMLRLR